MKKVPFIFSIDSESTQNTQKALKKALKKAVKRAVRLLKSQPYSWILSVLHLVDLVLFLNI